MPRTNAAPISPARTTAFDILLDVESGGYASDLLLARTSEMDPRDAGLAHQLVFGCLRYQAQLDYLIEHYSGRKQRLDREIRIALRLGIFQQRYLERIPRHAAVTESVELVKRARKRSASGFVNAVLRKVNTAAVAWPTREIAFSCPEWLLAKWEREYGVEIAEGIATAALQEPETWVRYAAEPPPNLEPAGIPGAYRITSGQPPAGSRVQDIGSQALFRCLTLRPARPSWTCVPRLATRPRTRSNRRVRNRVRSALETHRSRAGLPARGPGCRRSAPVRFEI
jgi:16S rRNA (cytosine967-C5)-methyltransferase